MSYVEHPPDIDSASSSQNCQQISSTNTLIQQYNKSRVLVSNKDYVSALKEFERLYDNAVQFIYNTNKNIPKRSGQNRPDQYRFLILPHPFYGCRSKLHHIIVGILVGFMACVNSCTSLQCARLEANMEILPQWVTGQFHHHKIFFHECAKGIFARFLNNVKQNITQQFLLKCLQMVIKLDDDSSILFQQLQQLVQKQQIFCLQFISRFQIIITCIFHLHQIQQFEKYVETKFEREYMLPLKILVTFVKWKQQNAQLGLLDVVDNQEQIDSSNSALMQSVVLLVVIEISSNTSDEQSALQQTSLVNQMRDVFEIMNKVIQSGNQSCATIDILLRIRQWGQQTPNEFICFMEQYQELVVKVGVKILNANSCQSYSLEDDALDIIFLFMKDRSAVKNSDSDSRFGPKLYNLALSIGQEKLSQFVALLSLVEFVQQFKLNGRTEQQDKIRQNLQSALTLVIQSLIKNNYISKLSVVFGYVVVSLKESNLDLSTLVSQFQTCIINHYHNSKQMFSTVIYEIYPTVSRSVLWKLVSLELGIALREQLSPPGKLSLYTLLGIYKPNQYPNEFSIIVAASSIFRTNVAQALQTKQGHALYDGRIRLLRILLNIIHEQTSAPAENLFIDEIQSAIDQYMQASLKEKDFRLHTVDTKLLTEISYYCMLKGWQQQCTQICELLGKLQVDYNDLFSTLLIQNRVDFGLQVILPQCMLPALCVYLNHNTGNKQVEECMRKFDIQNQQNMEEVCRCLAQIGGIQISAARIILNLSQSVNSMRKGESIKAVSYAVEAFRLSDRLYQNELSSKNEPEQWYGWFSLLYLHLAGLFCGMQVFEQIGLPDEAEQYCFEAIQLCQRFQLDYALAVFSILKTSIDLKKAEKNSDIQSQKMLGLIRARLPNDFAIRYLQILILLGNRNGRQSNQQKGLEQLKSLLKQLKKSAKNIPVDVSQLVQEVELQVSCQTEHQFERIAGVIQQFPRTAAICATNILKAQKFGNLPRVAGVIQQSMDSITTESKRLTRSTAQQQSKIQHEDSLLLLVQILRHARECPNEFKVLSATLGALMSMSRRLWSAALFYSMATYPTVSTYIKLQHRKVKQEYRFLCDEFFKYSVNSVEEMENIAQNVLQSFLEKFSNVTLCYIGQIYYLGDKYMLLYRMESCYTYPLIITIPYDESVDNIEHQFKNILEEDQNLFSTPVRSQAKESKQKARDWCTTRQQNDQQLKEVLNCLVKSLGPWICLLVPTKMFAKNAQVVKEIHSLLQQQLLKPVGDEVHVQVQQQTLSQLLYLIDQECFQNLLQEGLQQLALLPAEDHNTITSRVIQIYRESQLQINSKVQQKQKQQQKLLPETPQKHVGFTTPIKTTQVLSSIKKYRTPRWSSMRREPLKDFDSISRYQTPQQNYNISRELSIIDEEGTAATYEDQNNSQIQRQLVYDLEQSSKQPQIKCSAQFQTPIKQLPCIEEVSTGLKSLSIADQNQNSSDYNEQPILCLVLDQCMYQFPWERMLLMYGIGRVYRNINIDTMIYQRKDSAVNVVDSRSAYYLVNPEGDLKATQKLFTNNFKQISSWNGHIGTPSPSAEELLQKFREHNLFLYLGHGTGRRYLSMKRVSQISRGPSCLLMGCGSVNLVQQGDYDPSGALIAYVSAGCPVIIGNLWGVSDNDINRYSIALLQSWSKKEQHPQDLVETVDQSRSCCQLQYLTGGAPVVIGIPSKIL